MRLNLRSTIVWLVVGLLIAGHCPRAMAGERQAFKVGVILSLSGSLAEYGSAIVNGINLARQTASKQKDIIFLFEDAQNGAQNAVSAFNKLIDLEHVDLIYVWGVQFCKALAPLAEQRKVAMVAQCVNDDIARDNRYVIRFMNHAGEYTAVLMKYLRARSFRNLEVVAAEQPYVEDMYRVLEAGLQPGEQVNQIDRYFTTQMDFRVTVARLRSRRPDALGVYLLPGQIAPFYRQLREQHLALPTFGFNTFESQTEIDRADGAMEGAVFVNHHVESSFRRRYLDSFHNDSQITWAALAFEFTRVLEKLRPELLAAREPLEIIQALSTLPPQNGEATGPYQFERTDRVGAYFKFPLVLKEVKGGRIEERE
jgi:ABC-type branched-subunit amino acid transport system substrate-binding protein